MTTYTITEKEWSVFIDANILPLCIKNAEACIFALVGDLGAGKTTFSKLFLQKTGVQEHVQSPTFSIIKSYDISFLHFKKIFHIDVYRVEDIQELQTLHFEEILKNPEHIVVIEWADTIKKILPEHAHWIRFEHDTVETRKITIL